jgi:predicted nucleic acid-binding protein
MSAERAIYLDSSAIVKLAVEEPESTALRRYLGRRRPLISSALARADVARALLPIGEAAVRRGHDVLDRLELIRINDRISRQQAHSSQKSFQHSTPSTSQRPMSSEATSNS